MAGTHEGGVKSSEGGRGNPETASPAAVERYLKGIDFPANKDDLIQHAQQNEAPEDVLKVLRRLKEQQYNSPIDVSKAYSDIS